MARKIILHVGYDPVLTELRQQVLERAGYSAVMLLGNDAVRSGAKAANPDAIVIGSGGDYHERFELAAWLRHNMPGVPLLVMVVRPDEVFPPGIVTFLGDTARDWLIALDNVLEKSRRDARARAAQR
jgi:DNA-binding response OmpR family regulator